MPKNKNAVWYCLCFVLQKKKVRRVSFLTVVHNTHEKAPRMYWLNYWVVNQNCPNNSLNVNDSSHYFKSNLNYWSNFFLFCFCCFYYMLAIYRSIWYNNYIHGRWTQPNEFKSWMRVFAFHFVLMHLKKAWIHLFFSELWVNSRVVWFLLTLYSNQPRRRKTLNSNQKYFTEKLTSCQIQPVE